MNQPEIKRWNSRFSNPTDYVRIRTGNISWISAIFVSIFFFGIVVIAGRILHSHFDSNSSVESGAFLPTVMPTAFPTMMPTALPTIMPTPTPPPERIKPSGPPQPVPLPPRPANLSFLGTGFTLVVYMLALVIVVLTYGHTKQGFQFQNKWYSHEINKET